jgi:L-glyceraldehyde 3-phosphate reductase
MPYARCGRSGLKLPKISLGLWQNFGAPRRSSSAREMVLKSFDHGITHFDLANNYGPPPVPPRRTSGGSSRPILPRTATSSSSRRRRAI